MNNKSWKPNAGDVVEVRSKDEILATLEKSGQLDGLPFMPQMLQYCGQRLRVLARAHKTCDVAGGKIRALPDGVHLETRCDGQAYGGCQASCLIFWKTAWLKPCAPAVVVDHPPLSRASREVNVIDPLVSTCTEADIKRGTKARDDSGKGTVTYVCQATRVAAFTRPLAWWNVGQYLEDYCSGNVSLGRFARGIIYKAYQHGTQAWRNKIGIPARWLYDIFQTMIGGIPFPQKSGKLPHGAPAPKTDLNLHPGDGVRVKSHKAILSTIHQGGMNRGLLFDKEMVPFCGKVFRVKARVSTFVNERTGELTTLKTPAVILEGVWCQSRYSDNKMFCPRAIHSWWREIWLERVTTPESAAAPTWSKDAARESVPGYSTMTPKR
jgi:hypothetical protein